MEKKLACDIMVTAFLYAMVPKHSDHNDASTMHHTRFAFPHRPVFIDLSRLVQKTSLFLVCADDRVLAPQVAMIAPLQTVHRSIITINHTVS